MTLKKIRQLAIFKFSQSLLYGREAWFIKTVDGAKKVSGDGKENVMNVEYKKINRHRGMFNITKNINTK